MNYLIYLLTLSSIIGILTLSLNLVVGFTGLISVAQAAFYGIGAYTTAIFLTSFGINFFLSLILGVIISMIVGVLIGLVLSKFRDDYYKLATLGFGIIIYQLFLNLDSITQGPMGIAGIPRPEIFGFSINSPIEYMILTIIVLLMVYFLVFSITNSSFGRVLRAIREDEDALQVFGYRTYNFKLIIFSISAGIAAVAGALYASFISYIDPYAFTINLSIFTLAAIILGGLASNKGAVVGAIVLTILPEIFRFIGFPSSIAAELRQISYGLMLILCMLWWPKGLMGQYKL